MPPLGRTTMGATGGKAAIVGAGALGALALVGGVTFALLSSKKGPEHHDEPQAAASQPAALAAASQTVLAAPPVPGETSSVLPAEPAPPASTVPAVSALATSLVTPSKPRKTPKTEQAAPVTAATPGVVTAAPTPSCVVATSYDSDGQPHFKKVCK